MAGVCLLIAVAFTGCQGAQTTPTARPTAASSSAQSAGQLFGGQLPAGLPQDPAAGFGSVEIIQGTTVTLTAGRSGFSAGQAPDSQTPRARGQDGQTPQAQGQPGQGGQFQGGQGQRGQGAQGGQGQGTFGAGSASVVSLTPDTKYFKGVSAAPSGTPGAQGAIPPGAQPPGTPQPGNGPQDTAPQGPGAAPQDGGPRGDRQSAMAVEAATLADVQAGSLVMVWGSVIDGRIYADVVYIMSAGLAR
ncbi:MAG: hypothetical protein Q8O07_05945 [Chloroflexota bacterium]|nr:hypothetical protein [Chloroflexota bacterium]